MEKQNSINGYIYCFTNLVNGKRYIGQTRCSVQKRVQEHKHSAFCPSDSAYDQIFHRALRKYGWDNFIVTILASDIKTSKELDSLESFYINYYHSLVSQNGYNARSGGQGGFLIEPSTLHRMCMAKGALTEEEVIELRIAYKNHESPKLIYEEKYSDRLEFHAFMNIWSGQRYKQILPEYIDTGRRKKYPNELVKQIRQDREQLHLTYKQLSEKYGIPKNSIGNFFHSSKTSKTTVTTIPESGE